MSDASQASPITPFPWHDPRSLEGLTVRRRREYVDEEEGAERTTYTIVRVISRAEYYQDPDYETGYFLFLRDASGERTPEEVWTPTIGVEADNAVTNADWEEGEIIVLSLAGADDNVAIDL